MVVILPTAKQGAQNDFQQIRRTKNKLKKHTHKDRENDENNKTMEKKQENLISCY